MGKSIFYWGAGFVVLVFVVFFSAYFAGNYFDILRDDGELIVGEIGENGMTTVNQPESSVIVGYPYRDYGGINFYGEYLASVIKEILENNDLSVELERIEEQDIQTWIGSNKLIILPPESQISDHSIKIGPELNVGVWRSDNLLLGCESITEFGEFADCVKADSKELIVFSANQDDYDKYAECLSSAYQNNPSFSSSSQDGGSFYRTTQGSINVLVVEGLIVRDEHFPVGPENPQGFAVGVQMEPSSFLARNGVDWFEFSDEALTECFSPFQYAVFYDENFDQNIINLLEEIPASHEMFNDDINKIFR